MKHILTNAPERLNSILLEILSIAKSRPAGSESEEKVKSFIEEKLSNSGYEIQRDTFSFPIIPRLYNVLFIEGLFVIFTILFLRYAPLIGFLLPLIFSILPVLMLEGVKLLQQKNSAENMIAVPRNVKLRNIKLIIVTHTDTAQTIPVLSGILGKIISYCQRTLFVITYIIALQSLAVVTKITITPAISGGLNIFSLIIALITITYQVWVAYFWNHDYSPGANDNASGVAAALLLAEAISSEKNNSRNSVAFLFTSAEEQGLFGAAAFVKTHTEWIDKPFVINVDSIGGGNKLGLVTRYGRLLPEYTSRILNRSFKEIDHDLVKIFHIHRCGDYLPFYRNGFQVTSLEAVWNGGTPPEYHTAKDTTENLNYGIFSHAYDVLYKTIHHL
jgi:hypothetical protein